MTKLVIALLSVVLLGVAAGAMWIFFTFGQPFGKHLLAVQGDRSLITAQDLGSFRICTDASALPWSSYDPMTDRFSGGEVEMGKLLAHRMGLKAQFVNKNFNDILDALSNHACDGIVSAMTNTSRDSAEINFSNSYAESGLSLLVRKADAGKISGLSSLKGKTVGVIAGSDAAGLATSIPGLKQIKTYGYDASANFYSDLQHGQIDAIIYDQLNNQYYAKTHPTQVSCLCAASQLLTHSSYVVVVRADDHALLGAINSAIKDSTATGSTDYEAYKLILRTWYGG